MAANKKDNNQLSSNTAKSSALYYRDVGEGDAVLLLHAFPLNGRMWQPQLNGLRSRTRMLVPDLPGFGLSPAPSSSASLDSYAMDISAVLDELAVDRVTLVALAEGTYVALHLVEKLGVKLQGLLLASCPSLEPETDEIRSRLESLVAEVLLDGRVDPAMHEYLPKLIGSTAQRARPQLFDELQLMIRESTPGGVAAGLTSLASRPDCAPFLGKVRCPVLCVDGDEDPTTTPDTVPRIQKAIPGALSQTLPQCGRLCNVESPDTFNDAIVAFLAECAPTGCGS